MEKQLEEYARLLRENHKHLFLNWNSSFYSLECGSIYDKIIYRCNLSLQAILVPSSQKREIIKNKMMIWLLQTIACGQENNITTHSTDMSFYMIKQKQKLKDQSSENRQKV